MTINFELKSIIYFCKDMPGMLKFYTQVLGMRLVKNDTYPVDEWAELDGGGFRLCLHKAGNPGSAPHNRNKLVFKVADVGEARAYLIAQKVKMGTHFHWGTIDACDGRDPEGNKFQISGPATPE